MANESAWQVHQTHQSPHDNASAHSGRFDRDDIVVLSTRTNQLIDCIDVGRELSCLAVSSDGMKLFAGGYEGEITVLRVGLDSTSVDVFPDMLQLN